MLDTIVLLLLLALVILITWVTIQHYQPPCKNFPPGPWGIPFIGSFVYFSKPIYKNMWELSKQYGSVYSLKIGHDFRVLVSGSDAIKECLVKKGNDYADRPPLWVFQLSNPRALGIANACFEEAFQRRRRFYHTTLRGLGFGKTSMESKITEEITVLLNHFKEIVDTPLDIKDIIYRSVSNIICSITFGKRFEYTDPEFIYMIDTMHKWFELIQKIFRLNAISFLRPFYRNEINHCANVGKDLHRFCQQQIDDHHATFNEDNIRDFIDAYLDEARSQQSIGGFSDEDLQSVLVDLFVAGTDTTATTLNWALLLMILHPSIQEKVFNEIHESIGVNRLPKLDDRKHLPYTEATLLEVQRFASIAPFALAHSALKDSTLCGYDIPKGTIVILNLWSVHHDPKLWPEPDKFDPNRFYDASTETVQKHDSFMPFSAGTKEPSTEGVHSFTLSPTPYKIVITPRTA
uniref:Cytochrome P450 2U1-like n=1 Tax=Saccoglossus kowalevskii TaxID=10224 RepID=A0ABM0LXE4_SACKO|nr:PREDICTED: cytochrome P450 2U1-like [Saccoglossus kowalevskii]